jgi:hypothetical protein
MLKQAEFPVSSIFTGKNLIMIGMSGDPSEHIANFDHTSVDSPGRFPKGRVPSPNRYTADAKFCFWKNNKRMIIIFAGLRWI